MPFDPSTPTLGGHDGAAVLPPGTILLDKYRVDRELGRGGMGVVVAATHLQLGEPVALKFLLPEVLGHRELVARFMREAQAAVRLKGEHVARVTDVGTLPWGAPYLVMEYLAGEDLAAILERRGPLPVGELADYVLQACEGLAEAHAIGIVHRDIKPANLFVARRPDGSPLLKVLDFGISKAPSAAGHGLTATSAVMGTPSYMSPEQLRSSRDVDGRADLWALGVVLYEGLSGRRPFEAETFSALCLKAVMEPPAPLAVPLPVGLDRIVHRCLEKDANRRFTSVAELAVALAPYAGDPRGAAIACERAAALLGQVGAGSGAFTATPAAVRGLPTPTPTTLGASAGAVSGRRTMVGRGAWVGGALLAAVAAVLAIVFAAGRDGAGSTTTGPSATTAPAPAPSAATAPPPPTTAAPTTIPAAAAPAPAPTEAPAAPAPAPRPRRHPPATAAPPPPATAPAAPAPRPLARPLDPLESRT